MPFLCFCLVLLLWPSGAEKGDDCAPGSGAGTASATEADGDAVPQGLSARAEVGTNVHQAIPGTYVLIFICFYLEVEVVAQR